jgi:surface polysaccharide O-acyltransferase-like enzyme
MSRQAIKPLERTESMTSVNMAGNAVADDGADTRDTGISNTDASSNSNASAAAAQKHPALRFVYVLNILSCFAVVLLHTTLPVYTPSPTRAWAIMVCLQSAAIFAVPIFFMISGMNLLRYRDRYSTGVFFRRRLWKTGRALLLGSMVCYALFCAFPQAFYGAQSFAGAFGAVDFAKRFLLNQINDTYWFFYAIIYLYLLVPVLSYAVRSKRCMEYMLGLTAFVSVGLPLLARLGMNPAYAQTAFGWPLFSSVSLLYFLAGYYLHEYWKPIRHQIAIGLAVFALSSAGMAFLGLRSNGYHQAGGVHAHYDPYFVGLTSPLCVLQTVALFLMLQACEPYLHGLGRRGVQLLTVVSGASLGVYLFHIVVINWMGVSLRWNEVISRYPVAKAMLVYAVTALAVVCGKALIAQCKRFAQRKRFTQRRTRP